MTRFTAHFSSGLIAESRSVMRGLVRKPGYAIAAWVMLGLAVAANAAVFAIVYGFMLKPLPYAQPSQLSVVRERVPKIGLNTPLVSVKTYLALKQGLDGIADAGLSTNPGDGVATIAGHARLLTFQEVTPSLFHTLGVQPVLGRLPTASAGQPGGPPEAVISWHLWQSTYSGSRKVLGQSFKVGGIAYRIVGVMPADFFIQTGNRDAWLPFVMTPKQAYNDNINYWMVVRRKPGVPLHRLNLELTNYLQRILEKETPKERAADIKNGYTLDARSPHSIALNDYSDVGHLPWLLQAAAGLLLLLALANTVNLGLVRQRTRQHEFALRRVLGSSRSGLVRLILIEHLPIMLAVGITATLLAWEGIRSLHAFGLPPAFSPFHATLAPAVIAFAWILTVLAVLIVAFGPILLATGRRLLGTLGNGPTATGGKGPRRIQRTLGVVQIALSCALVIAGGLLGLSLWRVLSQPVGFTPQHRIVAIVVPPDNIKSYAAAWAKLKPALMKLPEVKSTAVTGMAPFTGNFSMGDISMVGKDHTINSKIPLVSAGFFSTLGIQFIAGRAFKSDEIANQARVIIINDFLAKQFFGSARKAIGQSLSVSKKYRVIGVTRSVLWASTPGQYQSGTAYIPLGLFPEGFTVIAQTQGSTAPAMTALKRAIKNALPGSVIFRMTPYPQLVQGAAVFRAAGAGMVTAFAALALLLAALGVFAITAFIARTRLGEYGIRAALGAGPSALLRLGFREAAWLLAVGLPLGLAGAYLLGRVIASALYQTPVFDAGLYVAGIVIIAAVVFAAAWGPARRAARAPIRDLVGSATQ